MLNTQKMIVFKFPNQEIEIKSDVSEFTLKEYDIIQNILNGEGDVFDKYLIIIEYLGIPANLVDDIDIDALTTFIKEFNDGQVEYKMVRSFELDGYTYSAFNEGEDKPKITARKLDKIEKLFKKDKYAISELMAILFLRDDLSNAEHYSDAHIKHKAKLFQELNAEISVPYIIFVTDKILTNIKKISNA